MNETAVLVVIGLVAAAFILRPLLKGRQEPAPPRTSASGAAPLAAEEELAELELDRQMGRVSEADYERIRSSLAAAVPRDAPEVSRAEGTPERPHAMAASLVAHWRNRPRVKCPVCGLRPEAEARFCSNCGRAL
jgi:cytochrome c-type biogenesis protein CcmI